MKKLYGFFTVILVALHLSGSLANGQSPLDPKVKVDFKKEKITLNGKTLSVEIADNELKRERGLMFRTELKPDQGMLFIFDDVQVRGFWMMNTLIPLSIGFFDEDRKLVKALEMEPAVMGEKNPPTYSSEKPAKYALEMSKDWMIKNKIKPGAEFKFKDR
jgi:uncharacterized membrane protein (UPF0127 family)